MIGVLAQDQPQVPFASDQHPVQIARLGFRAMPVSGVQLCGGTVCG